MGENMLEEDDSEGNEQEPRKRTVFEDDFIRGCISFLAVALLVRGEQKNPSEKFTELISPIMGNRDPNKHQFADIVPEVYKKVVLYCSEAVVLDQEIEKVIMDTK